MKYQSNLKFVNVTNFVRLITNFKQNTWLKQSIDLLNNLF